MWLTILYILELHFIQQFIYALGKKTYELLLLIIIKVILERTL